MKSKTKSKTKKKLSYGSHLHHQKKIVKELSFSQENEIKPVKKPTLKKIATIKTDPDVILGINNTFYNPDYTLNKEGLEIEDYDKAWRDAHTRAVLSTRFLAVSGREWSFKLPEDSTRNERKVADFLTKTFKNTNFDYIKFELLKAVHYGYWGAEIMWKIVDDKVVVDKFISKHSRRFTFTTNEKPRLITAEKSVEGESIPPKKFLIYTFGDNDTPHGQGLGQTLYYLNWFKHSAIKFWLIFIEKFGMPTIVGKFANKDDLDQLYEALKDIQKNSVVALHKRLEIEYLKEAQKSSTDSYEKLLQTINSEISKLVLGQTLTTDNTRVGSYALGKVHQNVRQDILESDADMLDEFLNNTIVKWLIDFNFNIRDDRKPVYTTHTAPKPDLKEKVEIDKILIKDIGLRVREDYLYEKYEVDKPEDDESVVTPPKTTTSF